MAVLTADKETEYRGQPDFAELQAAIDIIYKGSLVSVNATGWAAPSTDAADESFVGICVEKCDNSGGAAGDVRVKVARTGVFLLTGSSLVQADVGAELFVSDDNIVTNGTGASNNQAVGTLIELVSASSGWVDIGVHTPVASG